MTLVNGFNPNDPSDATLDPDGDGKTNLEEFELGTNPLVPNSISSIIQAINGILLDDDE